MEVKINVSEPQGSPPIIELEVRPGSDSIQNFTPILRRCAADSYEAIGRAVHMREAEIVAVRLLIAKTWEQLTEAVAATLTWQLGRSGHTAAIPSADGDILIGNRDWLVNGQILPRQGLPPWTPDTRLFCEMVSQLPKLINQHDKPQYQSGCGAKNAAIFAYMAGALRPTCTATLKYAGGELIIGAPNWGVIGNYQ